MKKIAKFLLSAVKTRLGFILTLLMIYWLKTIWAYYADFSLDIGNAYQALLSIMNPIPIGLLLMGLSLYIKNTKAFYTVSLLIYTLLNILLIANAIYFREFSDFITVSAAFASSKTSAGLGDAAINLLRPWDVIYIIDCLILIFLLITKRFRLTRDLLIKEPVLR